MKKIALFRKYGESAEFVARFDSVEEASDQVKDIINEDEDANVFDFYTEEQEYTDIRERVKTYADACEVLGIAEMDEKAFKACGFRPDEIARRKLETITEALNEGWCRIGTIPTNTSISPGSVFFPARVRTQRVNPTARLPGLRTRLRTSRLRIRLRTSAPGFASTTATSPPTRATRSATFTPKS